MLRCESKLRKEFIRCKTFLFRVFDDDKQGKKGKDSEEVQKGESMSIEAEGIKIVISPLWDPVLVESLEAGNCCIVTTLMSFI